RRLRDYAEIKQGEKNFGREDTFPRHRNLTNDDDSAEKHERDRPSPKKHDGIRIAHHRRFSSDRRSSPEKSREKRARHSIQRFRIFIIDAEASSHFRRRLAERKQNHVRHHSNGARYEKARETFFEKNPREPENEKRLEHVEKGRCRSSDFLDAHREKRASERAPSQSEDEE